MNATSVTNSWIVCVAHGNLDLLDRAITSFKHQDVDGGCRILVVDNESGPVTRTWLSQRPEITTISHYPQHSVARAWNTALSYLFSLSGPRFVERVLVCNSDIVLRPDTFRWLESEQADFVTAVGSADRGSVKELSIPRADAKRPHPDFSCFMISRWCYGQVGPFDENFRIAFVEDSDYHMRMHNLGIRAYSIDLPFWHVDGGSQTIKRANESEREQIVKQAAANRMYFARKWGFQVPTPENGGVEYYQHFGHVGPEG